MPHLCHALWIDAAPETVFDAVATEEGLKRWWTANTEVEGEGEKAKYRFGFDDDQVHMDMVVEAYDPPRRLVLSCTGGVEEWAGTRLVWELEPQEGGGTWVTFTHEDWDELDEYGRQCNTIWGHLMFHLAEAAQRNDAVPFFEG